MSDQDKELERLIAAAEKRYIDNAGKLIAEQVNQVYKWGEQNHEDGHWMLILQEEVGEAAKAILEEEDGVREELIQVAAVALSWIDCIDRRQRDASE